MLRISTAQRRRRAGLAGAERFRPACVHTIGHDDLDIARRRDQGAAIERIIASCSFPPQRRASRSGCAPRIVAPHLRRVGEENFHRGDLRKRNGQQVGFHCVPRQCFSWAAIGKRNSMCSDCRAKRNAQARAARVRPLLPIAASATSLLTPHRIRQAAGAGILPMAHYKLYCIGASGNSFKVRCT